jgi:hypothetical protein
VVEHYAPYYQDVFSGEAWVEFKRYISGLMVCENKTVDGINRLCVMENRNQSSLNRLLTESPFSLEALNEARLGMLAAVPGTQMKAKGVLGVDDTLLTHYGQGFEQIAKLYDHTTSSYVWAHNLVTVHYSDDETDYPVVFQLWKPVDVDKLEHGLRAAGIPLKASKESLKESAPPKWRSYLVGVWQRRQKNHPELLSLYESKLTMAQTMLQQWVTAHPECKMPVTFDSWYTQPGFCRFLDKTLHLPYVGTLSETDEVTLKSGQETLGAFAKRLKQEHLQAVASGGRRLFHPIQIAYKGERETYYSYCNTHRIDGFGKQRLVINYRQADLADNPTFYISNRLVWRAKGITRIRRHRWPVEVYHQEGKAEGLDQYQVRNFSAIQRHVALVAVVYSVLRAAQHDPVLHHQLQRQLKITLAGHPASWRRAAQAQSLWCLGLFISSGLAQGQSLDSLMAPFIRAVCRVSVNRLTNSGADLI